MGVELFWYFNQFTWIHDVGVQVQLCVFVHVYMCVYFNNVKQELSTLVCDCQW